MESHNQLERQWPPPRSSDLANKQGSSHFPGKIER
jgi:hypothetical protein